MVGTKAGWNWTTFATQTLPLMRLHHGLRQLMQRVLIHRARIKHVAAGKLVDLYAAGITHDRHLVYAEYRSHERAREVVPSMHDQHAQLGIGSNRLAQVSHRTLAQVVV